MLLNRKSIFIAEDNLANRVIYQTTLMMSGAFIEFERWGPGTLKALSGGRKYDLIILDLMLSQGASGYHIFEEIRDLPKLQGVPIIAVSAAEPSEAMARCRELGFDGYIAKPINEELFPAQLARVLTGEDVWIGS